MSLVKWFKFSITLLLLFVLIISSACQRSKDAGGIEYISLNDLKILSQKGKSLNWANFNNFSFEDIGSGIYIRKYKIEGGNQLFVTGKSLESPPERIYSTDQNGKERDLIENK